MSTVTITIKTDNAAFTDYEAGETARILRRYVEVLEQCETVNDLDNTPAYDINGNKVALFTVKE